MFTILSPQNIENTEYKMREIGFFKLTSYELIYFVRFSYYERSIIK